MGEERPVPEWLLERLLRGELPSVEAARLRARLEAQGEGGRLQALERSDREILEAHPPAEVAAEVHRRARREQPRAAPWRSTIFSGLALGAAGLAVVFAMGRTSGTGVTDPTAPADVARETTTAKGLEPRLALYRKQDRRAARLSDGARARPGDLLQVTYVAAGKPYGVIVSIDAKDAVTLHLPGEAGPAPRLQTGKEIPLSRSFELDATPGFERFVFVTSDAPFDTDQVVSALRRKGPPLPPGLSLSALTVHKDPP